MDAGTGNAIEVRNVSKYYSAVDSQWQRLRQIFSLAPLSSQTIRALHDVSFSVAPGEALGIIGSNGSGKSTLLQIVAGILRPTSGTAEIRGRCATLLELGSGFAPEFTGRQNVALNATILGLTREEIDSKMESILHFAGIGDFIDQPIRTYSSGMVLRLAFAVAAQTDPQILIVDEALAVGDIAFRQRCLRRIHELRAAGVTILFVSHDAGDIKALCERCLWLDNGVMRALGEADDVAAQYLAATLARHTRPTTPVESTFHDDIPASEHAIAEFAPGTHRFGNGDAAITAISLTRPGSEMLLRLRLRAKNAVKAPIAGFLVRNAKGETIFGTNSARENHPLPSFVAGHSQTIDFHVSLPRLAAGEYSVSVALSDGNIGEFAVCDYVEDAATFHVAEEANPVTGYIGLPCQGVVIHRG